MINVLLVDDHALVRSGLARIIREVPDINVIAEASSGEEAIKLVRQQKPDVIIMDVNMPGIGGIEATRKLLQLYPDLNILALTAYTDDPYPSQLLKNGAMGYLTKGCLAEEVIVAIRTVSKGKRYVSSGVAQDLALSLLSGEDTSPLGKLSQRELQVMLMVTKGHNIQEISDKLCLSPKTVSTYRYRLYEKLNVHNDVELTHLAIRYGMLDSK